MAKITVKLKYDELLALDDWLGNALAKFQDKSFADKCVKAVMYDWYLTKVKTKTYFRFPDKISFKLSESHALALAHIIQQSPVNTYSYIGGTLLLLLGEIDNTFK